MRYGCLASGADDGADESTSPQAGIIRPAHPAVADRRNELLMTLVVRGCFQCSAGKLAVPTGTVAPLPIKSQL
jgi:hypothetical protein